ncbi:unnamed protein product [Prunus armeniaca]
MVAFAQMIRTFDTNSEALIPGQVVLELIDSNGGFCVRDSYLEEIGCVTVDGNPSWCWILWKGEGIQKDCLKVLRRHQAG